MRTIVLALAVLCASAALAPRARATETRAFVYATDFGSGAVSNIAFGPPRTVTPNLAAVCADAVLRYANGHLAVIERFGCDGIRLLDPSSWGLIREFSVGNGSNPNDYVEVSPTKAYVTRYGSADLWIVDPTTGAHTGTISLAGFADADGLPEMNRAVAVGGRLFVTCQRIDSDTSQPTDSSAVVAIDCAADTVIDCDPSAPGRQGILLPFQNPTTKLLPAPGGDLLVGCTGAYGVNDGGVVRIDPRRLVVDGIEAVEADLGGDVIGLALNPFGASGAAKAFCVVSDASFHTSVVSYQRATGQGVHVVRAGGGFVYSDIEVNDRDELWVGDRTGNAPGVRVFDCANDGELTTSPLDVGLAPQDIAFDAQDPAAVPAFPAAPALAFAAAWPNPSRGAVSLRLLGAAPGPVSVLVVDARGRVLHRATVQAAGTGEVAFAWDGRADGGFRAPAGVYWIDAFQRGRTGAASIRLIRLSPEGQP